MSTWDVPRTPDSSPEVREAPSRSAPAGVGGVGPGMTPAQMLWLSRTAGNRAVVAATTPPTVQRRADDGVIRRKTYTIDNFVKAGEGDNTAGVKELAGQVKRTAGEFRGSKDDIRAILRQSQNQGTGAFAQGLEITVDVAPPNGAWPDNGYDPVYNDIAAGERAGIWDQIIFELRNAYNSPQFTTAKQVGMNEGKITSGGDAKSDVECITLVLYLRDLQTALKKTQQQARLGFANAFSVTARRSIVAILGMQDLTPAALMTWFAATPHGGAGALPNTQEAQPSNVMYTVERVEGWNRGLVEKIVVARLMGLFKLGSEAGTVRPTVTAEVATILTNNGYPQDPDTMPGAPLTDFNTVVAAIDQAWLQTAQDLTTFLTLVGVTPDLVQTTVTRQVAIQTEFQDANIPQNVVAAAAMGHGQLVPPVTAPLTQQEVQAFGTLVLPLETAMTAELKTRYRKPFSDEAKERL